MYATVCLDEDPSLARKRMRAYIEPYYGAPLEAVESIQAMFAGSARETAEGVAYGTVEAVHGPAQLPDATLNTTADVLVRLAEGGTTLAEAINKKTIATSGDRTAL